MKDIPGTRIGEGSCVVHDYNGDGYDEVFNFEFSGRGRFVQIFGYDFEKESIVNYAGILFEIIDRERGPAPAEFITYKGMKGFKVYLSEFEVAGGPGWVSLHCNNSRCRTWCGSFHCGEEEEDMKHTTFVVLLVFILFLTGCLKKTESANISHNSVQENNSENKDILEVQDISLALENSTKEIESIRSKINIDSDPYRVIDLVRVNFGVPDGENWLVTLQSERFDGTIMEAISLFLVNDDKIAKSFSFGRNYNLHEFTQYDIMKDIPGTRMGSGASAYGDNNGDGVMDLFRYAFGGNGWFVNILGYDAETDEIISYCDEPGIPFGIIDTVNGPAPTEFMTYNGRYGFKVYIEAVTVAGGPDYVPEPMPYNNKWFFYSWDETQKMYIEIGEVKD